MNEISRQTWEEMLDRPQMKKYLECLHLTVLEAQECDLFGLLDRDESGSVTAQELIDGCIRLAGNAKSMDLWYLHGHFKRERQRQEQYRTKMCDVQALQWD